MRTVATIWEVKAQAAAQRDKQVEELARVIFTTLWGATTLENIPEAYRDAASILIESGWRKTEGKVND